jgi:hypothetical protein
MLTHLWQQVSLSIAWLSRTRAGGLREIDNLCGARDEIGRLKTE